MESAKPGVSSARANRKMKEKLLIIDDDKQYTVSLAVSLKKDFDVYIALNEREAREMLTYNMDAVLLDINFSGQLDSGDTSGFTILEAIREEFVLLPVIILSNYENPEIIIQAFRKGANDYVMKGLLNILELKALVRYHLDKRTRINATVKGGRDIDFIGSSPQIKKLKEELAQIAVLDTTILITGETGVGKEVAAHYIHHMSGRTNKPFVTVNIAALPTAVIEAELFGYKKGAFTDARSDKKGYFEVANYGTLFLDEIGDLPYDVQTKLLRFIEERMITPLGSTRLQHIDVRLICATNKNLEEEMKKGAFREDLYYRINVYPIVIPPLKERKDDIKDLVEFFCRHFSEQNGISTKAINSEALSLLSNHDWKGNIRELRNVIESALIKASIGNSEEITSHHLPAEIRGGSDRRLNEGKVINGNIDIEREMNMVFLDYAERALDKTMGNKLDAALMLGLKNDETLRYKIKVIHRDYPDILEGKKWICKLYGYLEKK
jgi:DNA-binding NtrC family response regulator